MRPHFWLMLVFTGILIAMCGWLLLEFPNQQRGTSLALQYQQWVLWSQLVCTAGVYLALVACVLSHAWAARWRFWVTLAASALYLWVAGGGLVVTFVENLPAATPDRVAQVGFFLFIEGSAALMYAAALLLLYAAEGLWRPRPERIEGRPRRRHDYDDDDDERQPRRRRSRDYDDDERRPRRRRDYGDDSDEER